MWQCILSTVTSEKLRLVFYIEIVITRELCIRFDHLHDHRDSVRVGKPLKQILDQHRTLQLSTETIQRKLLPHHTEIISLVKHLK